MNDKDYNCYVDFRLTNFRGSCVDDKISSKRIELSLARIDNSPKRWYTVRYNPFSIYIFDLEGSHGRIYDNQGSC